MMALTTKIEVDCENVIGELRHIWTSIGFDEINWSYTERGKNLLQTLKGKKTQLHILLPDVFSIQIHFSTRVLHSI